MGYCVVEHRVRGGVVELTSHGCYRSKRRAMEKRRALTKPQRQRTDIVHTTRRRKKK